MKLIYRATSYDYDPTQSRPGNTGRPVRAAHRSQEPYTLIYRGLALHVDPNATPVPVPATPATYDLIYRGLNYHVNRDAQGVATAFTQPVSTKARTVSVSASPRRQLGQVHQANLTSNLQRRLEAAQARGDQQLIDLLEAERQQIEVWSN